MGGHAFPNLNMVRLDKEDFLAESYCIMGILDVLLSEKLHATKSYTAKQSFGDLDLVTTATTEKVAEVFRASSSPCKVNGNVASVAWPISRALESDELEWFQVDFICVPETEFSFACHYLDFNDLGNLIGRTYKRQGFSLGHQGLRYKFPGTNKSVTVTLNWLEAMTFMDYDYDHGSQQFDTTEDLFKFVAQSRYFSKEACLLGNRSHRARARDGKRPVYKEFMTWLSLHEFYEQPADKYGQLDKAFKTWPEFVYAYYEVKQDIDSDAVVAAKFNGHLVTCWTGLTGEALGRVMADYKKDVGWKQFTLNATETEIKARVLSKHTVRLGCYG
jgi:hypothetical protein